MTDISNSLALHARRASLWSGADAALRALLGFAITVLLARLVTPAEFGIVAMILVFSALGNVLIDSGLSTALIQRQDADHRDESTVFYFNVSTSMLAAFALAIAAPWIASFFEQPALVGITRLMATGLVIGAFGSIHSTLLIKALDFRPLLFITLWSWLLSGALAVVMALRGYGAWSLAWQVVAQASISTVLLWTWHRWRPLAVFNLTALRKLFAFGGRVLAANVIDTFYTRLYSVFIGKLFSASDLGFYTRAQSTQQLPTNLLANMLNRVALPAFARISANPSALRQALAKASRLLMFINLPLMAGMAVTAQPLVIVLFGVRWLPVVPLLQVLCVVGALWPLQILNVSALLAQGHSRLLLRLEVIKKGFGMLALIVASPHGLLAIAWSQVVTACFAYLVNCFYSDRLLGFGAWAQLRAIAGTIAASLLMLAVVALVQQHLAIGPLRQLLVLVPLGVLAYVAASMVFGLSQLREIAHQLRLGAT
jgi:O-antigen/teichoic acid export membrane protein